MTYAELKQIFQELKRKSPREDLTAHIIFTEDSIFSSACNIGCGSFNAAWIADITSAFGPERFGETYFFICASRIWVKPADIYSPRLASSFAYALIRSIKPSVIALFSFFSVSLVSGLFPHLTGVSVMFDKESIIIFTSLLLLPYILFLHIFSSITLKLDGAKRITAIPSLSGGPDTQSLFSPPIFRQATFFPGPHKVKHNRVSAADFSHEGRGRSEPPKGLRPRPCLR